MKKVNDIENMVYENRVLREFKVTLEETGDLEQSMHDALLISEGIFLGGSYLGFEYNFKDVYKKLCSAYEYNKKFGGNNE